MVEGIPENTTPSMHFEARSGVANHRVLYVDGVEVHRCPGPPERMAYG